MQIKNQAASAVQRAFINDVAPVAGMAVEESSGVCQRKVIAIRATPSIIPRPTGTMEVAIMVAASRRRPVALK